MIDSGVVKTIFRLVDEDPEGACCRIDLRSNTPRREGSEKNGEKEVDLRALFEFRDAAVDLDKADGVNATQMSPSWSPATIMQIRT